MRATRSEQYAAVLRRAAWQSARKNRAVRVGFLDRFRALLRTKTREEGATMERNDGERTGPLSERLRTHAQRVRAGTEIPPPAAGDEIGRVELNGLGDTMRVAV